MMGLDGEEICEIEDEEKHHPSEGDYIITALSVAVALVIITVALASLNV